MKLSISNIAWSKNSDEDMYLFLQEQEYSGLEIAPTRIFEENPYEKLDEAKQFAIELKKRYGLKVSSMQSIWFGRNENIFGSVDERDELFKYTKKAIRFAEACGCSNLVFGCPKNRIIKDSKDYSISVDFFRNLGEYAKLHETNISIEPNPRIYNTNFINYTEEAFQLVSDVDSDGFNVNIDLGTIIYNKEDLSWVESNLNKVNHIHISEPNLQEINIRGIHREFAEKLKINNYNKYVSIEMKNNENIELVRDIAKEIKKIF